MSYQNTSHMKHNNKCNSSNSNQNHQNNHNIDLVELFNDDYKSLQSSLHKMINAMRVTPRKDYSPDALHMLIKIQELHQSLLYLCSQTELELLKTVDETKQTNHQSERMALLRTEQKIMRKWMPYILQDMLEQDRMNN